MLLKDIWLYIRWITSPFIPCGHLWFIEILGRKSNSFPSCKNSNTGCKSRYLICWGIWKIKEQQPQPLECKPLPGPFYITVKSKDTQPPLSGKLSWMWQLLHAVFCLQAQHFQPASDNISPANLKLESSNNLISSNVLHRINSFFITQSSPT